MPPTSDGDSVRTVGCALVKLVPDPVHLQKIRDAVATTHKATILASELLNLHIRRVLDHDPTVDLSCCFSANFMLLLNVPSPKKTTVLGASIAFLSFSFSFARSSGASLWR